MNEFGADQLTVIGVALDDSVADVQPWVEGIEFPVLIDQAHVLSELFAISNVPTIVWIEADGTIARPNAAEFGSDMFAEFTGVKSEPHMEAVRQWVRTGEVPDDADGTVDDFSDAEIEARMAFRIATHLRREGSVDQANQWFARAAELAPLDYTIRRAAMPLQGVDPFGEAFFELHAEWEAGGRPFHGLSRDAKA